MRPKIQIRVEQHGNDVTLFAPTGRIEYEVEGLALPPLTNVGFGVWHVLPYAMLRGATIEVDGPVDAGTIAAAMRYSETWELWRPAKFRKVNIVAASTAVPAPAGRRRDLVLFSGGLDSTDMLLQIGRRKNTGVALTVHGFDYAVSDTRFQALIQQTRPLLDELNYEQVIIRTNATDIARGGSSYPLRLVGLASLLSGIFEEAVFSADYSVEQDIAAAPWSLNHVTNGYFRTDDIVVKALCDDRTRAEKVLSVLQNEKALRALSFCQVKSVHPRNCGKCQKCLRTKLMFQAMAGHLPSIFDDMSFGAHVINDINLKNIRERVFFVDLYQKTRDRGNIRFLPELEDRFNREFGREPEAMRPKPPRPAMLQRVRRSIKKLTASRR